MLWLPVESELPQVTLSVPLQDIVEIHLTILYKVGLEAEHCTIRLQLNPNSSVKMRNETIQRAFAHDLVPMAKTFENKYPRLPTEKHLAVFATWFEVNEYGLFLPSGFKAVSFEDEPVDPGGSAGGPTLAKLWWFGAAYGTALTSGCVIWKRAASRKRRAQVLRVAGNSVIPVDATKPRAGNDPAAEGSDGERDSDYD
jgi:hypothetical protein